MGNRPGVNYSIERRNPNGIYEKDNCYWATTYEQVRNRRNNVFIEYNGVKKVVKDWESEMGLNLGVLSKRIKRGWTVEDVMTGRIPKTASEAAKIKHQTI